MMGATGSTQTRTSENSYLFLHKKVGLWIGTEDKRVTADLSEAVLFVKTLGPWIVFPNAKPDRVEAILSGKIETCVHQSLADALTKKLLLGIKPVEFYRLFRRNAGFDVIENELCIARELTFYLSHQENGP